jgi:hypothetical protein
MSDGHNPLSPRSLFAQLIVGFAVTIVGGVIVGVIVYQLTQPQTTDTPRNPTRGRPAKVESQRGDLSATHIDNTAVDVRVERAECDRVSIRVIIAVKVRDTKRTSPVHFAHITGYFVDSRGRRYESGLTTLDNVELSPMAVKEIKPGETYRYCLGPAKLLEIGMGTGCPVKSVTAYLEGIPASTVAVKEGGWPRVSSVLELVGLAVGFIYIIATAARVFMSPDDTSCGFACCGCFVVPFAGSVLASIIWSFQYPNSPAPGGDFLPPDFLALQWRLMFAGLIILASIINCIIELQRRRDAGGYIPPPPPRSLS